MVQIIVVVSLIISIIFIYFYFKYMDELAKFRDNLSPGQTVFYLSREDNRYYSATILSVFYVVSEHTVWKIKVHRQFGDEIVHTSELNLFHVKI